MFGRKRLEKFKEKIYRIYNKRFAFMETVLNSCVTLDQLDTSARWAADVLEQYRQHERGRIKVSKDFMWYEKASFVDNYFSLKRKIVLLIFERKIGEIENTGEKVKDFTE